MLFQSEFLFSFVWLLFHNLVHSNSCQTFLIKVLLRKQNHNHLISCLIDNKNILLIETEFFIQYHVFTYSLTTISFYSSRMVEVPGLYECKLDIINKLTIYDCMHVHVWLYIKQSGRISICLWTHRVQAFLISWVDWWWLCKTREGPWAGEM